MAGCLFRQVAMIRDEAGQGNQPGAVDFVGRCRQPASDIGDHAIAYVNVGARHVADMGVHSERAAIANNELGLHRVRDGCARKRLPALIGRPSLHRAADVLRGAADGFSEESGSGATAQAEHGFAFAHMRERRIVGAQSIRCKVPGALGFARVNHHPRRKSGQAATFDTTKNIIQCGV